MRVAAVATPREGAAAVAVPELAHHPRGGLPRDPSQANDVSGRGLHDALDARVAQEPEHGLCRGDPAAIDAEPPTPFPVRRDDAGADLGRGARGDCGGNLSPNVGSTVGREIAWTASCTVCRTVGDSVGGSAGRNMDDDRRSIRIRAGRGALGERHEGVGPPRSSRPMFVLVGMSGECGGKAFDPVRDQRTF